MDIAAGNEYQSFNVLDNHGIELLNEAGIEVGIITVRNSRAVKHHMQELGIKHFYPDQRDKLVVFKQLAQAAGLSPNRISYTGYDLADLPIMLHCGLAIAVNNANGVAKKVAHWATPNSGGKGSVREVCELILYAQQQLDDIMEYYLGLDDSLVDGASS